MLGTYALAIDPTITVILYVTVIASLILAIQYKYFKLRNTRLKLRYKLELDVAEMNLKLLRSQLNPHFIFNSLNAIENYIIKNSPAEASNYLNDFARLMRLILQNSKRPYIKLKDELETIALYLEMERLRLESKFDYQIELGEGMENSEIEVTPFLITPYIENSIWDSVYPLEVKGRIQVSMRIHENTLLTRIVDNGIGRQEANMIKNKKLTQKSQFSMLELNHRRMQLIKQLYGADVKVEFKPTPNGNLIELQIPTHQP